MVASPEPLAALSAWLDEEAAAGRFSGVVRVSRGPDALFEHAAGLASRAHAIPNATDTRFAVASIGKLPLAVAALRLVERGVFDLQAPVVDLLPPAHRPDALTSAHTLHHLLSQTSGLPNWYDDGVLGWDSFEAAVASLPGRGRHAADLVPLFASLPARRPPGEAYEYCDGNFVLAGLVIEAATGRDWADVVAEEVIAPARMGDTGFEALDDDPARLATGYLVGDPADPPGRRRTNVFSVTARPMPDGGMLTTAADLATLLDSLAAGDLLGPQLLDEMLRPHAPSTGDPEQYGYGCLLAVAADDRVVSIGHGGEDPGVSAMLARWVAEGVTVAVLSNQDRGAWPAWLRVVAAFGLPEPRAR